MARRRRAEKREVQPDSRYGSRLVTLLVNFTMRRGKKSVAEKIIYGAFDKLAAEKQGSDPLEILERAVGKWVSAAQRGFLQGRQMLHNVLDVDYAAQKISLKCDDGAIMLFDFRAAFPSMDQGYMWDALAAIGLPPKYIQALQCFYAQPPSLGTAKAACA